MYEALGGTYMSTYFGRRLLRCKVELVAIGRVKLNYPLKRGILLPRW